MLIHRLKLFVPVTVVVLSVVKIANGAALPAHLIECRALTSTVERLDCYDQFIDAHIASQDQAVKREAVENTEPAAPAVVPAAVESGPAVSRAEDFGKSAVASRESMQAASGTEEIDRIEARVAEVHKSASGKAVITLDNGQVWMQIDSLRARFAVDDTVTVRKRSMGSFTLYNNKTSIRVKRID